MVTELRLMGGQCLTEINRVNPEDPKALLARLLAVRARAVSREGLGALDKSELVGEEDLITLPSPLEPFRQECFIVAIKAIAGLLAIPP